MHLIICLFFSIMEGETPSHLTDFQTFGVIYFWVTDRDILCYHKDSLWRCVFLYLF